MYSPHSSDTGAVVPYEYLNAAPGTYQAGQMLTVTAGKLAPISAASKATPKYLCMANITVTGDELVAVTRVKSDVIYETQLSAAAEAATVGSLLEVSAGGLQADAAEAGTFEVVRIDGTAAGSTVCGRFV